jgi:hypothetical protein
VISDEQEGAEGYIVDIAGHNVSLYYCLPEQSFSDGSGREVRLFHLRIASCTDVVSQITLDAAYLDFDITPRSMTQHSARTPSINSTASLSEVVTLHGSQIPSAPGDPEEEPLYVGRDPCQDMEVIINVGECKLHVAVVRSTRKHGNKTLVDIRTTTKLKNIDLTLEISDMAHLQ